MACDPVDDSRSRSPILTVVTGHHHTHTHVPRALPLLLRTAVGGNGRATWHHGSVTDDRSVACIDTSEWSAYPMLGRFEFQLSEYSRLFAMHDSECAGAGVHDLYD